MPKGDFVPFILFCFNSGKGTKDTSHTKKIAFG